MWRFDSLRVDAALIRNAVAGIRATIAVPKATPFTYTAKNPTGIFGIILLVGFLPDAFFRHLLIAHRFAPENLAFDALELATALWICGAFATMVNLPHRIDGNTLHVRFGHFADIPIPLHAIRSVEAVGSTKPRVLRRTYRHAHVLHAIDTPLVRLDLHEPLKIWTYPFLHATQTETIFIPSDLPEEFERTLKGRLPQPV